MDARKLARGPFGANKLRASGPRQRSNLAKDLSRPRAVRSGWRARRLPGLERGEIAGKKSRDGGCRIVDCHSRIDVSGLLDDPDAGRHEAHPDPACRCSRCVGSFGKRYFDFVVPAFADTQRLVQPIADVAGPLSRNIGRGVSICPTTCPAHDAPPVRPV